jgi:trans-aconitate methyltransferase
LNSTKAYYDALARYYDAATAGEAWTPNSFLISDLEAIRDTPISVLDLGAGTGHTSAALSALYPQASITAVDFSSQMLTGLLDKVPSAKVVTADIRSFAVGTHQQYDLVVAIGCLEFLPNLTTLLPHIVALTRPSGHFCFTHEPLITGSVSQNSKRSVVKTRIENAAKFTIYRHTVGAVHNVVAGCGHVDASDLFVSYQRDSEPVVYHYVRLART